MRLVIAGGGTGGHLFPGIAVAEEFLSRDPANEVLFVGTERGIEARVLPRLGYPLEIVEGAGIVGKGNVAKLKGLLLFMYGYAQSRKILKRFMPDAVLGVGGYASAPVVLASRGLLISRFIHEQNAYPGLTNKAMALVADQVFISLDEAAAYFPKERTLLTGNPLRRQIVESLAPAEDRSDRRVRLLVFGGSLGAHSINMAMSAVAQRLAEVPELEVLHQTGEKDLETVTEAYAAAGIAARVVPFIDDMATAYRAADLIVCRAGATTIAEITASGKAALFIPFPHATGDHQRKNAEALLKKDACFLMTERELTPELLAETILGLLSDRARLDEVGRNAAGLARRDAAKVIVDEIMKKLTNH